MPQIGWLEILAVVIIAIIVLGPKEFPVALKKIGSYLGKLKNTLSNFQREISSVTNEIDVEKDINNQSDLEKFKAEWPKKIVNGKKIASLIKTNESRKMMRAALGIDIKVSPEEAINTYWTLADFLQKGNVEKVKVDESLKKRQRVISNFKNSLGRLKRKIEKQDLSRIMEYLQG